jgi:hypothetical protein
MEIERISPESTSIWVQDRFLPSCGEGQDVVACGQVIEVIFPEGFGASALMDTAESQTCSAPGVDQNMPDCLQREPTTVLHPASIPPEPMKSPWARKLP